MLIMTTHSLDRLYGHNSSQFRHAQLSCASCQHQTTEKIALPTWCSPSLRCDIFYIVGETRRSRPWYVRFHQQEFLLSKSCSLSVRLVPVRLHHQRCHILSVKQLQYREQKLNLDKQKVCGEEKDTSVTQQQINSDCLFRNRRFTNV